MANAGVEEIGLFRIGESMLVKRLPEYFRYAKSLGFKNVYLTINSRLAKPARIEVLIDNELDSIKFSASGLNRKNYIAVTGIDAFNQIMDNIDILGSIAAHAKNLVFTRALILPLKTPQSLKQLSVWLVPMQTNIIH
jgi:hypothetical protein